MHCRYLNLMLKNLIENSWIFLYDADDETEIELVPEVESTDEISESEWEVSDFFSSDDSCDEWHP